VDKAQAAEAVRIERIENSNRRKPLQSVYVGCKTDVNVLMQIVDNPQSDISASPVRHQAVTPS
jgi:hypothetical protein